MDFRLSDEQRLLQREAREFLARHCPSAAVQAWRRDGVERPPELWRQMAALGWHGFAIAPEYGGLGADCLDLALLFEECGRALVPTSFASTVGAALAIAAYGPPAVCAPRLSAIARGECSATLAVVEAEAVYDLARIETALVPCDGGYVVRGKKSFVEAGADADLWVVAARRSSADRAGVGSLALALVERGAFGVHLEPLTTFSGDPAVALRLEDVRVAAADVLEAPRAGRGATDGAAVDYGIAAFDDVRLRLTTLLCAEMVGGFGRVLELTTNYVKTRTQFGRPIGSFQAVQHALADMAIALEGARYATYQAAWRLARGLPADREVAIAKAWTSPAYARATLTAHQLHGGMGFVTEYPLHLYSGRAKACETKLGGPDHHLDIVAAGLPG
jgi:alkylation response protein AidB-like acyl-CoA dehydrogenase